MASDWLVTTAATLVSMPMFARTIAGSCEAGGCLQALSIEWMGTTVGVSAGRV
jgi:hypothetical protein